MRSLRTLADAPWKGWNEGRRIVAYPWHRLFFALNGIAWGVGWRIYGTPTIMRHARSKISIGARLNLRSSRYSNPLSPARPVALVTWREDARLEIGDDFGMTGGSVVAATRVIIGNRVNIGANSTIIDTDFHPLRPVERQEHPNAGRTLPVLIEDDVFIGMNCLVLKGVRIGAGAVIGAGSVVSRDVLPHTIVAGNPARTVGSVEVALR